MSRPLGHIRQVAPGKWRVYVDLGKDSQGKRIRLHRTVNGTRKDAQEVITSLRQQYACGQQASADRMTVADLFRDWLRALPSTLSAATRRSYRTAAATHILPAIGGHRLQQLRPQHCEALFASLATKGYRTSTIKLVRTVLSMALNAAVRWEILGRNPAALAAVPRGQQAKPAEYLSVDAARDLLARLEGSWLQLPAMLGLYAGLRIGEVLGLQWRDIDLNKAVLVVQRGMVEGAGARNELGQTKNRRARTVSLPATLVEALRRQRDRQVMYCESLSTPWAITLPVVYRPDLSHCCPKYFTNAWRRKAGLRFHALRHTHASLLLLAGTDIKTISERLGHADVKLTLNTYSHVLDQLDEQAALAIEAVLEPGRKERLG